MITKDSKYASEDSRRVQSLGHLIRTTVLVHEYRALDTDRLLTTTAGMALESLTFVPASQTMLRGGMMVAYQREKTEREKTSLPELSHSVWPGSPL